MFWTWLALGFVGLFALSLTPPGVRLRRWMMARMYTRVQASHEAHIAERKRTLLAELSGTVLEIGPGTGVNFQYMPDTVERWIGIEPNPFMHAELREAGAARGIESEFRTVSTEGMDVESGSVDTVLSTLVLCSVPDPSLVMRDIHRVLKPGGRFVFLEHVAAPRGTSLRRLQTCVKPLWRYFADGCCPNRELADVIREAGFETVEIDEFRIPKPVAPAIISPTICGVARK